MSRLSKLTPQLIRAMYSTEADDTLIPVVVAHASAPIRISENFTHKFQYVSDTQFSSTNIETDTSNTYTHDNNTVYLKEILNENTIEDIYGVQSNDKFFLFVPFSITLPQDQSGTIPTCKVTFQDVSQQLIPIFREMEESPPIEIKLVSYRNPDVELVELQDFYIATVTYTSETVEVNLSIESFLTEPFPAHTFSPSIFPGMF